MRGIHRQFRFRHGIGDLLHRGRQLLRTGRHCLHVARGLLHRALRHLRLVRGPNQRNVDRTEIVVHDGLQIAQQRPVRRDVGGELYHLERLAAQIEDRVVRGLDPHLPAALADPAELRRLIAALAQRIPELPVLRARRIGRFDEHRVRPSLHLGQRIAQRAEEFIVGGQHGAVQGEGDHRLRFVDRGDLPGQIGTRLLALRHVGGELDHFDRRAVAP